MTLGFMSLYAIMLEERVGHSLWLLPWLLALGVASVIYWHLTDDLRPYLWVQFYPLVTVPLLCALFPAPYSHQFYIGYSVFWYAFAKLVEVKDALVFRLTRYTVSGHTVKHLTSCVALYCLFRLISERKILLP